MPLLNVCTIFRLQPCRQQLDVNSPVTGVRAPAPGQACWDLTPDSASSISQWGPELLAVPILLNLVISHRELDIGQGGNIYTNGLSGCHTAELCCVQTDARDTCRSVHLPRSTSLLPWVAAWGLSDTAGAEDWCKPHLQARRAVLVCGCWSLPLGWLLR